MNEDYKLLLIVIAVVVVIATINALINFFVKLLREARKAVQLMVTMAIIFFLVAIYFAPNEMGEVIGVVVDIFKYLLKGVLKILRSISL